MTRQQLAKIREKHHQRERLINTTLGDDLHGGSGFLAGIVILFIMIFGLVCTSIFAGNDSAVGNHGDGCSPGDAGCVVPAPDIRVQ